MCVFVNLNIVHVYFSNYSTNVTATQQDLSDAVHKQVASGVTIVDNRLRQWYFHVFFDDVVGNTHTHSRTVLGSDYRYKFLDADFAVADHSEFCRQLRTRNIAATSLLSSLKWINVQATLLDICIAFYPLRLPPYAILEIVDRFPFWSTHVNRKKKIDYIIQIKRFCDNLIENRK
jgi:hypothetical protein